MAEQQIDIERHTFRSPAFKSVVEQAVEFFDGTPVHTVPPNTGFLGVGVYALYYLGDHELYASDTAANKVAPTTPAYVGKAVPEGWRTTRKARSNPARELYGRLREHSRSIRQGADLRVEDFRCRFMILGGDESDLISTVEAELIRRHSPLWNTVVDGFGNHDPGKGRYNQARSEWDVLHAGRPWADRLLGTSPELKSILAKLRRARNR